MSDLNRYLEEALSKVPNLLLRKAVSKKLEDQGVEDEALLDALMEHIQTNGDGQFVWDDGEPDKFKNLSIEFSDEDTKSILSEFNKLLKEDLPEVISNSVQDTAKAVVKGLENEWPEQKIEEDSSARYFRDRLNLRWSKGLDPLRMMLIASREVGQEYADKLSRSKAKKGIARREVTVAVHARACQTALEILTLLENGLADGAYARWRTLYELSVVAMLVDRFGDEIAERYLAHDAVSMREAIRNEYRHDQIPYDPQSLKGTAKTIETEFQSLVSEFGKSFAGPYGWAADSIGKKAPRFQDLEEAIEWKALPPNYKWSSHKIHAGVAGTLRTLGSFDGELTVRAGASNAGIEIPAVNTAFSLLQITTLVFGKRNDIETQIQMQALILLRDKVVRECRKAAKRLERDEMEIRRELDEI
ncbi:DUF5677 domain-containing protein [Ruegeria arenilitoris]|uniref:DUF5677 domain-containing protein n=1 Tax=Ruegeria arenilitoris TaxID=1173585 RepID=UPI00147A62DD|nr:DUF5677 domain-containing protein [Ruegeria arenilitoris]